MGCGSSKPPPQQLVGLWMTPEAQNQPALKRLYDKLTGNSTYKWTEKTFDKRVFHDKPGVDQKDMSMAIVNIGKTGWTRYVILDEYGTSADVFSGPMTSWKVDEDFEEVHTTGCCVCCGECGGVTLNEFKSTENAEYRVNKGHSLETMNVNDVKVVKQVNTMQPTYIT